MKCLDASWGSFFQTDIMLASSRERSSCDDFFDGETTLNLRRNLCHMSLTFMWQEISAMTVPTKSSMLLTFKPSTIASGILRNAMTQSISTCTAHLPSAIAACIFFTAIYDAVTRFYEEYIGGRLGVAYVDVRWPYSTRHAYATAGLMAGANPAYMANQLGHSVEVFFKDYAAWINSALNAQGA